MNRKNILFAVVDIQSITNQTKRISVPKKHREEIINQLQKYLDFLRTKEFEANSTTGAEKFAPPRDFIKIWLNSTIQVAKNIDPQFKIPEKRINDDLAHEYFGISESPNLFIV